MITLQINGEEDSYYKEGKPPAHGTTSLLSSASKWLNSAVLRDLFAQENLRRNGDDVGVLQLVPEVMNEFHRLLDANELDAIMQRERQRIPEFSAWLDKREITFLNMETADRYKAGTLGAILRDFYRATGFSQILAFGDVAPANDFEFYTKQRTFVHDIEHLVTGFGTDPAGELGMMYLYLPTNAKYFSPELASILNFIHSYLASTWTMRTDLYYPQVMPAFMESISVGLAMASQLRRPLPLEDWTYYFDCPIDDVRRELNITPADPNAWAWTEVAWRG